MKLVIQRVKRCKVKAGSEIAGSIEEGLFVLVGLHKNDKFQETCIPLLERLYRLRLHSDPEIDSKWSRSLNENKELNLILVSQFTLFARTDKGKRPDFHEAMERQSASQLFNQIVSYSREKLGIDRVATGTFGEHMEIEVSLDGPVTILLEN